MGSQDIHDQLHDYKVTIEIKIEAQPTHWTTYGLFCLEIGSMKPKIISLEDFPIHHLFEALVIKRKSLRI